MGTTVLMEKLGLHLTIHDITYVYRLQATGRKQYTLVARNFDRKLVTGLSDSSKGRDEDFLVIMGNWQNPLISCPLVPGEPDKEFTAKKVEFVERKTVEHLLKRPCFIDSGRRPHSAPILLGYEPSYKSFQSGSIVKDSRQAEVTVSRPGRDQEEIIQVVPLTARKEVQVHRLVTPLKDPNFVPSLQSSEAGLPVKQSINIGSVLGALVPQSSETSPPPLLLGFSQGESVMKKRKREQERVDEVGEQQAFPPTEPLKTKSLSKKGKKGRPVDEDDSVVKGKEVWGGQVADAIEKALLLSKDMMIWQGDSSERLVENMKRDSVLAVQGIFEAGSRLLETERFLNQSLDENDQLKDLEKMASTRIQATKSKHKSVEAGLMTAECQKAEDEAQAYYDQGFDEATNSLKSQLTDECNKYFFQGWRMVENLKRDSILAFQRIFEAGSRLLETERLLNQSLDENDRLKDLEKTASARIQATKGKHKSAEASLMTVGRQGWRMAFDKAGVDDASELYDLGPRHQPFQGSSPEECEGGKPLRAQWIPNLMKP
uniref:Uncharacterized protein n=1 Tax=Fagus sylvatica TaxID=28930 RepID=A0A2N9IRN8_FAGSY